MIAKAYKCLTNVLPSLYPSRREKKRLPDATLRVSLR